MPSSTWYTANSATLPTQPITPSASFQLTCPAKTDIWRRSPSDSDFSAPILYRRIPSSKFRKLTATIFASWKTQYDQAGVVLAFPTKDQLSTSSSSSSSSSDIDPPKWIKAGIEYFSSAPVLGVVGCDRLADWSLCPLRADLHQKAKIVIERKESTVWVYAQQEGDEEGGLRPLREIKWAFGPDDEDGEMEIWAGVYVAKPTPEAEDEGRRLEVTFEGVEVEVEE